MKYGFNDNGVLRDVVMTHPSQLFQHHYANQFIELPDDAQTGFVLIDGAWQAPTTVTPAPTIDDYTRAVQTLLDNQAQSLGYDSILSLCSYVDSSNPVFAQEAARGKAWRDEVWSTCISILEGVQNGVVAQPTIDELVAMLPEW